MPEKPVQIDPVDRSLSHKHYAACFDSRGTHSLSKDWFRRKKGDQIVETAVEARAALLGGAGLRMLVARCALAILVLTYVGVANL